VEETHASLLSSNIGSILTPLPLPLRNHSIFLTSLPYYFFSLCNRFSLLTPAGGGGGGQNKTTTKKHGLLSFFVPFYIVHAYWENIGGFDFEFSDN
jgi:hypothetical protein